LLCEIKIKEVIAGGSCIYIYISYFKAYN
jgi:hypothetical protein